jgi:hypothetical protein
MNCEQLSLLPDTSLFISVASNSVRGISCLYRLSGVRVCTIRYNVYSNWPFSKAIIFLLHTFFSIGEHEIEFEQTEQNE